jgi:CRISPR/Cas system-associated exonuclease Cas4 (RecB family)
VDKPTQDALAHKLRRDRGTVLEAKTVTEFAVASGKAVRREPAKSYRKLLTYNDISWVLVGRVDARDENTIVEVKNRTRRFMCPDYDVLQLQAYMYLCNKSKGILLERLHGENRETPFEFNESYWNEAIIPAMYEFVREVEERVIMSRSILDGVTPPLSPRKRACAFGVESPSKVTKVEPGSPVVRPWLSWDKKDHQGDNKVGQGDNEVCQGNKLCQRENEVCQELFGDDKIGSLQVIEVLHASSWDNEPSSDLGENSSQDANNSFTLYLSPSDTESDEELANMPLDDIINCM